jgi:hypothetical protein
MGEFTNRVTKNQLRCGWCGVNQNEADLQKIFSNSNRVRMSMPCENCSMPLDIRVTKLGFLVAYQSDRKRFYRNIEKGVNTKNGLRKFSKEKYESGEYDVVTRDGKEVVIAGFKLDAMKGHQVVGWLTFREGANEVYGWDLKGKLYGWDEIEYPHDLFLKLKNN